MGLSGGMDSGTLLGYLIAQGFQVHCCIFNYGSKHNEFENAAAGNLVYYYQSETRANVDVTRFDLSMVMGKFKSDLLLSGGEIPEGHYNDENMKRTVVPGRNMIFASIMAGMAESIGAEAIALGVHAGDHHIYPDCRKEYIKALDSAVYLSSDRKVEILAPFILMDKTDILKLGYSLTPEIPYELTRTCYKHQANSCGKCGSCQERLEAFQNIGKPDPIVYE